MKALVLTLTILAVSGFAHAQTQTFQLQNPTDPTTAVRSARVTKQNRQVKFTAPATSVTSPFAAAQTPPAATAVTAANSDTGISRCELTGGSQKFQPLYITSGKNAERKSTTAVGSMNVHIAVDGDFVGLKIDDADDFAVKVSTKTATTVQPIPVNVENPETNEMMTVNFGCRAVTQQELTAERLTAAAGATTESAAIDTRTSVDIQTPTAAPSVFKVIPQNLHNSLPATATR